MDVGAHDFAAGHGQTTVCVNLKPGLEPVQRCIDGRQIFSQQGFGVPAAVDGFRPQHVGWLEVQRIKHHDQFGAVQGRVKLHDVGSGGVDGFVPKRDVEFRIADGVVEHDLDHAIVRQVAKVQFQGGADPVDHHAGVQVLADQCTVGHHQLGALLYRYGGVFGHGDVGVDR